MYDYTPQILTALSAALVIVTVLVYERWVARLKAERNAAIDHAEDAQELLDALLGAARDEARDRHPSNVRVLRAVD